MATKTILKEWMLEDNGSILQDLLHPGVFTGYVINGEKVKCLKYTAGGASREQFPQISNPYLEEE